MNAEIIDWTNPEGITPEMLAARIDQTLLKPDVTASDIDAFVAGSLEWNFANITVPPVYARRAVEAVGISGARVGTVVGFPYGYDTTTVKLTQVNRALDDGCYEIDVVAAYTLFLSGESRRVQSEIELIVEIVHTFEGHTLKVILETGFLQEDQIRDLSALVAEAGVDFVKTSTGVATRGASLRDIELMREGVQDHCRIKAAGGIRTADDALRFFAGGADRIGTSSGLEIVRSWAERRG